jgi:hypothetical protein
MADVGRDAASIDPFPESGSREEIEEWLDRPHLRAVADTGDQADAERVDELARRDREQHESQQSRDE